MYFSWRSFKKSYNWDSAMLAIACSVLVCQYYLNGWTIFVMLVWVRRSDFIWNNWRKITVLSLHCIIHMKGISKYNQPLTCSSKFLQFHFPVLIWGAFVNSPYKECLLIYEKCLLIYMRSARITPLFHVWGLWYWYIKPWLHPLWEC